MRNSEHIWPDNGVPTDIHYATPPHLQPCYEEYHNSKLAMAETLANEVVSIPIAHPIGIEEAIQISSIINNYKE